MLAIHRVLFLFILGIILTTFMTSSTFTISAQASMLGSQMVTENNEPITDRDIDEIKVKRVLEHKLVSERLKSSGLSKEQVVQRMDNMSDQEIHKLASMSDKIPAGGNAAGPLIGALVLVVVVLLVIYLVQRT